MSVNVSAVEWVGSPTTEWNSEFKWKITVDCIAELKAHLEWRVIYAVSDPIYDQILESVPVGPFPIGACSFNFEAPAPDHTQIPEAEMLGVSCVILSCSYVNQEFIKIGYFVRSEYADPKLNENPPKISQTDKMIKTIAADQPKVTRFIIDWNAEDPDYMKELEHFNGNEPAPQEAEDEEFIRQTSNAFKNRNVQNRSIRTDFLPILTFLSSNLNLSDIAKCRRVCKSWYNHIQQGLQLKAVTVEGASHAGMFQFGLKQCSPSLESFVSRSSVINNDILSAWLDKCGASLLFLNLENCSGVNDESVKKILQRCPKLKSLLLSNTGVSREGQSLDHILKAMKGRLTDLSLSQVSVEGFQSICRTCGDTLVSLSVPDSHVTEKVIFEEIPNLKSLNYLGIPFCSQISPDAVDRLKRLFSEVEASHSPADFQAELMKYREDSGKVAIVFRLLDQHDIISPDKMPGSLLPDSLNREGDMFLYNGKHSAVSNELTDLGFSVFTKIDWEDDLEDESSGEEEEEEEDDEKGLVIDTKEDGKENESEDANRRDTMEGAPPAKKQKV
ncbi:hypothetical protein PROFUN_09848 [Planoprotostelium fungivorum]|uniref:Uncharacterized protein n=1 Tax=Planoprotostelium fungivorum TaxID=1890364 RepID=A0A2P6NFL9_9EUKA|nr:hypothetical protein PROFUN_09848 [Planoprotostelium fungivorum]